MDGESALQAESAVSAPERRARRAPDAGRRATQRLRSLVLGPPGGGTTRRRASDAVRFGTAVLLVAVTIPLIRANTSIELRLAQLLSPPPNGIRWLVSTLWLAGFVRRDRAARSARAAGGTPDGGGRARHARRVPRPGRAARPGRRPPAGLRAARGSTPATR